MKNIACTNQSLRTVNLLTLPLVHSCTVSLKSNGSVSSEAVGTNSEKSHILM